MNREIVLDTETTGLDPKTGHRVIEVAAIEIVNLMPTGRYFHRYINPERDIDMDAERIHGLSRAFLADKPTFATPEVAGALLEFVGDAPLVAHNAGFDRAFLNNELELGGYPKWPDGRWIDTLALAQKTFPGAFNSLDALCKRYKISLADREKHGALVDTRLLASVYLELRGGREASLDLQPAQDVSSRREQERQSYGARPGGRLPSRLTAAEDLAHKAFVLDSLGPNSVWETKAGSQAS